MGISLTPHDVGILKALLPEDIALGTVAPKALAEAVISHGGNSDRKIWGRLNVEKTLAAVFVTTDTGGELISLWNSEKKEVPYDALTFAKMVKVELMKKLASNREPWAGRFAHSFVFWLALLILAFAPLLIFTGWSEVVEFWGPGRITLGFMVPSIIFGIGIERFRYNFRIGKAWAKTPDRLLVREFLLSQGQFR